MYPMEEQIEVSSRIEKPLKVLLVDGTQNKKGWEFGVSTFVLEELRKKRIPIEEDMVHTPSAIPELQSVLEMDYSALLYFAHGCSSDKNDVDRVTAGNDTTTWYLLQACGLNMADKMVVLCVCGGLCPDSLATILRGALQASILIAPNDRLSKNEAKSFLPAFFKCLMPNAQSGIDPEWAKMCLNRCNILAHGKMNIAVV